MLGSTVTAKTVHRPEARGSIRMAGWWFQTFFIFHNTWDNLSHWLSYFSRWLKPPTRSEWLWGPSSQNLFMALETTRWGPWPYEIAVLTQPAWAKRLVLLGIQGPRIILGLRFPNFNPHLQWLGLVSLGLVKGKLVRKPLYLMGRKHGSLLMFPPNNPLIIVYSAILNHLHILLSMQY